MAVPECTADAAADTAADMTAEEEDDKRDEDVIPEALGVDMGVKDLEV